MSCMTNELKCLFMCLLASVFKMVVLKQVRNVFIHTTTI